jgi:hypothetical protein
MYTLVIQIDNIYKIINYQSKNESILSLFESIDYELFILEKHKINIKLDLKNLSNKSIQHTIDNNILLNKYYYDFKKFTLIDQNNNEIVLESSSNDELKRITYLNNSIKNRFNKINKKIISSTFNKNKTIFKKKNNNNINIKDNLNEKIKTPLNSEEIEEENKKKSLEFINKEKESEKKSIYKSDLKLFSTMKKEISEGNRTVNNIPPLFKEKYNVLLEMENSKSLYLDDSYDIYYELLNDNIDNNENNLLGIEDKFNKKLFDSNCTSEFKNYKSLETILDGISSIEETSSNDISENSYLSD